MLCRLTKPSTSGASFLRLKKVASLQSPSPFSVQVYGQLPGQYIAHRVINESPDRQVALQLIKASALGQDALVQRFHL